MAAPKKSPAIRTTKPITVKLRYDVKKKKLRRPDPVTLVIENNEEICWTSKHARLEINFAPQDRPFLTTRFRVPLGGGICSGVPSKRRTKAREQTYRYTVTAIAINQPNAESKKRCSKVRLTPPVKTGRALPMVEGEVTIRRRKSTTASEAAPPAKKK